MLDYYFDKEDFFYKELENLKRQVEKEMQDTDPAAVKYLDLNDNLKMLQYELEAKKNVY